ncbi:uncharacterized protein LOC133039267 [Cannabis sativa]|uniref:uncharacterized protein LOC133039267 n=1 Tax=Cannabis sativa TaxID=3483 RepID=UPI0029CA1FAF|nr:uncharacterized protein LOC133039267 [Cannabis sativa]
MSRMGFNDKFVRIVYGCLSSVQYKIVTGGRVLGPITPTRGICQGDPISPYLFLLCAEGLSALIRRFEERKWLHGCRVANGAPVISHMLFVDDSYLYCKATEREVSNVLLLLETFAKASGQLVNFSKSSVFFSSNTSPQTRGVICSRMGLVEADERSKYLGLPSVIGRNKNASFGFLKDKVQKRIRTWDNKFLSKAGKEVLIKSVVQSLPTYTMNVFLLPIGTCHDMRGSLAIFGGSLLTKGVFIG